MSDSNGLVDGGWADLVVKFPAAVGLAKKGRRKAGLFLK
jgi:hypothetical protein